MVIGLKEGFFLWLASCFSPYNKTQIVFSKGVLANQKQEITNLLGVSEVDKHEKYLGLPTVIGRSKKAIFSCIKDRIWKKLQGWKEKLLSRPRKEVLIKAVIQAIPTYLMSIFRIPEGIIQEINSMVARFWWGANGGNSNIHWHNWNSLCNSKSKSGLGFRDMKSFNSALLAKQIWRIHNNENPLLASILKARYFKRCDVLASARGYDPSYTWSSVWGAKDLLTNGLFWRVGTGLSINIWKDNWVQKDGIKLSLSCPPNANEEMRVADLINHEEGTWDLSAINDSLDDEARTTILNIPLSRSNPPDRLFWIHTKDGKYSVKSGYRVRRAGILEPGQETQDPNEEKIWNKLWNVEGPPKLHRFLWRACKGSLAVNEVRHRRHIAQSSLCTRCGNAVESIIHALLDCPAINSIWNQHPCLHIISATPQTSFKEFFNWLITKNSKEIVTQVCTTMWAIWFARNKSIFQESAVEEKSVVASFLAMVHDYNQYAARVFHPHPSTHQPVQNWNPPNEGWIKINFDAHVTDQPVRGLGIVARNHLGNLLAAGVKRVQSSWDVATTELVAALYGVELALRMGYSHVNLEGDSSNVVSSINNKAAGYAPSFLLLDRLLVLVANFVAFQCSFVRRTGNTVAHLVA